MVMDIRLFRVNRNSRLLFLFYRFVGVLRILLSFSYIFDDTSFQ
jgi:hypothetical protein